MGIKDFFKKNKGDADGINSTKKDDGGNELGFLSRKILERQLKSLPKQQQEMIMKVFARNPDFFKKIDAEVKQKKKQGIDEKVAMMQIMRAHQSEFQKMMMDVMK